MLPVVHQAFQERDQVHPPRWLTFLLLKQVDVLFRDPFNLLFWKLPNLPHAISIHVSRYAALSLRKIAAPVNVTLVSVHTFAFISAILASAISYDIPKQEPGRVYFPALAEIGQFSLRSISLSISGKSLAKRYPPSSSFFPTISALVMTPTFLCASCRSSDGE